MENKLVCGSQNYCWLVGDKILISCRNMIIHLENVYDVVIMDFFVIFCLSMLKCTYDKNYIQFHSL